MEQIEESFCWLWELAESIEKLLAKHPNRLRSAGFGDVLVHS